MTVSFKTLGCRLNQAEEVVFASQFLAAGWRLATTDETPDVIVLHSCAVTRAAERETFRQIRSWRKDPHFADTLIVVTGCAVACNTPELFHDAGADLVVAKRDQLRIAELVVEPLNRLTVEPLPSQPSNCQTVKPSNHKRALLKVQDGCGFNCAYCIVPLTRGKPVSRPWKESLADAQRLLDQSYKEIVLTGCNLACYRDGIHGLTDLADAICGLAEPYGARIRLGSVEPGICDDELLSVLLSRRNLCRFLHYPIQSGDTGVLRAMGRRYTAEYITELLQRVRDKMPLIGLGADFITGLPGEDEDAFSHTCALVEAIPFVHIHVFPYSPRQGTLAPTLPNRPSRTIAKERASRLRAIGDTSAAAYRQLLLGHETQVLVEKRLPGGAVTGWNEGYVLCRFPSDAPVATLATFTPDSIEGGTLAATEGQEN
ncbi:MAG: MiaB/RimO family radical SAM methylthiotransferase [Kiritimatiellae bacterium]|nr:MiaB/RimO family radical SAM methylthiotransferase [Kiritimatiellia bacterium]